MEPEFISDNERTYCMILPRACRSDATRFFSKTDDPLQVGLICRRAGERIDRHFHLPFERHLDSTWEFLLVRNGSMTVTIYDDGKESIAERRLEEGDAILLMGGGHGFVAHDDLTLLEVKQGPYAGGSDKEQF